MCIREGFLIHILQHFISFFIFTRFFLQTPKASSVVFQILFLCPEEKDILKNKSSVDAGM